MTQNTRSKNTRKITDKETVSDEAHILQTYGPTTASTPSHSNKKQKNTNYNDNNTSTIDTSAMDVDNNISLPFHLLSSETDILSRKNATIQNQELMIVDSEKLPSIDSSSAQSNTNQQPSPGSTS